MGTPRNICEPFCTVNEPAVVKSLGVKLKGSVTSENLISKGSLSNADDAGKGVHPRAIIILLIL